MSAVKKGEGLATVENITVARLGIWLEKRDTSAGIYREDMDVGCSPSTGVWEGGRRDVRFFGANGRWWRKKGKQSLVEEWRCG